MGGNPRPTKVSEGTFFTPIDLGATKHSQDKPPHESPTHQHPQRPGPREHAGMKTLRKKYKRTCLVR